MPGLFTDSVLQARFAVTVVFTPISIAVTGLRFLSARLIKRHIGMEDWFALGALLCFLLWVVFLALMAREMWNSPGQSQSATSSKMIFLADLMFPLNQFCAKMSILFLYYRIFGVFNSYGFWIKAVGVLHVVYSIENFIVNVFQCMPVRKFWEPQVNGHCINFGVFLAVNESINSLIDFTLAVQAVLMLRSLSTTRKITWRLSLVFLLGGLAGVFGFVKIGAGLSAGVAVGNEFVSGVWATVQMGFSIICCCVITFKPLLTRLGLFASRITSKLISVWDRRHCSHEDAPGNGCLESDTKEQHDPFSVSVPKPAHYRAVSSFTVPEIC